MPRPTTPHDDRARPRAAPPALGGSGTFRINALTAGLALVCALLLGVILASMILREMRGLPPTPSVGSAANPGARPDTGVSVPLPDPPAAAGRTGAGGFGVAPAPEVEAVAAPDGEAKQWEKAEREREKRVEKGEGEREKRNGKGNGKGKGKKTHKEKAAKKGRDDA